MLFFTFLIWFHKTSLYFRTQIKISLTMCWKNSEHFCLHTIIWKRFFMTSPYSNVLIVLPRLCFNCNFTNVSIRTENWCCLTFCSFSVLFTSEIVSLSYTMLLYKNCFIFRLIPWMPTMRTMIISRSRIDGNQKYAFSNFSRIFFCKYSIPLF